MKKLWFIYDKNLVSGPFATEDVDKGLNDGRWTPETLVWWKGRTDWLALGAWKKELPQIMEALKQRRDPKIWHAECGGKTQGPMSRSELLKFLTGVTTPYDYNLWTEGMNKWESLFFFHEIIEELGITRRSHPRVPLQGTVMVQRHEESFTFDVASISLGGMGFTTRGQLNPGDTVSLTIKSNQLSNQVRSHGQVAYVRKDGYCGLKFENMHVEAKTTIIDYVRQFRGSEVPWDESEEQRAA